MKIPFFFSLTELDSVGSRCLGPVMELVRGGHMINKPSE